LPGEDAASFAAADEPGDKTTAAVLEKRIAEPSVSPFKPDARLPTQEKEQPSCCAAAAYLADQRAAEALPTPQAPAGDVLKNVGIRFCRRSRRQQVECRKTNAGGYSARG
jgi:hypothetical protein